MWDTCTSHFGPKKFDRVECRGVKLIHFYGSHPLCGEWLKGKRRNRILKQISLIPSLPGPARPFLIPCFFFPSPMLSCCFMNSSKKILRGQGPGAVVQVRKSIKGSRPRDMVKPGGETAAFFRQSPSLGQGGQTDAFLWQSPSLWWVIEIKKKKSDF